MSMNITISDSAVQRVAELIKQKKSTSTQDYIGLRVSVDGGGCSGLMYKYELAQKPEAEDFILDAGDIKLLVDPMSQSYLEGCKVDFTVEIGAKYFHIINPNAAAKCGCGNSFSV